MNNKEIRWRQRFENLLRAYTKFKSAVDAFDSLSMLEKEGLIQRFEYTLELSWKTVKDYLESQEVMASFPKEVIKAAFHYEIIDDGDVWMEMLQSRNLMAHTYDEKRFNIAINKIKDENLPVPYYFDIIRYNNMENGGLKEHIDKEGKGLYYRQLGSE